MIICFAVALDIRFKQLWSRVQETGVNDPVCKTNVKTFLRKLSSGRLLRASGTRHLLIIYVRLLSQTFIFSSSIVHDKRRCDKVYTYLLVKIPTT